MARPKQNRRKAKSASQSPWKIRCICGVREEANDDHEAWIQCDECQNWQHNVCMGVSTFSDDMPDTYKCEDCDPDAHQELLDAMNRGERPWETRRAAIKSNAGHNNTLPLTDDCHHYTRRKDVEWDIQKYCYITKNYVPLLTAIQILGPEI